MSARNGNGGRVPVAVLGATGAVGQTFIRLLEGHPYFEVAEVAASERSAGRPYREAMTWHEGELPDDVASALNVGDDIAVIHEGKIVEDCSSKEIRHSQHPFVRDFLGTWFGRQ